jgi:NAD+ kinase
VKKIGIVVNSDKPQTQIFSKIIKQKLLEKKIKVWVESDLVSSGNQNDSDLIIILGGDGTVLRAFHHYGKLEIPFMCINFGKMGFLSAIEPEEAIDFLPQIFKRQFLLSERLPIRVSVEREGNVVFHDFALNDLVIRSKSPSLSRQKIVINNFDCFCFEGDGLICATSTGSTGYALSAGGCIVDPLLDVLIISPLCSVKTYIRPFVLGLNNSIKIICQDLVPCATLTIDGREHNYLIKEDVITISPAPFKAKIVQLKQGRYFQLLQSRLKLG